MAVLSNWKLKGWMDGEAAQGYMWIMEQIEHQGFSVPYRDGMISLESLPNRTNIKVNISGKEVEEIRIHIKAILRVTEFKNLDIDPRQAPSETKEGLTRAVNQEIEKMVDASLKKTQLLQADVFELGERVRMVSPSLWKQHSDEWNEDIFPGIPIRVEVHTTIRDIGETYQTVTKK